MTRAALTLTIAVALTAAATASSVRIIQTNSAGTTVHLIDPATNKVVGVINGIEVNHGATSAPDGSRLYVTNEADRTLDVVDARTLKVAKKIELTAHPNNVSISRDGRRVYVAIAAAPGAVDVIDTTTLTRAKSIPVNGAAHNTYVTPDGKYAVSGSVRHKFLNVVDLATEQTAWEIKFDGGVRPMTFDVNPDGSTRRIYAQLSNLDGFVVVDFAEKKEIQRILFPAEPRGYGVAEGRIGAGVPSHGIGVAPDGKTLWVNSHRANAVFVYSTPDLAYVGYAALPDLKLPGRDPIGAIPDWLTFTPDSKLVYVGNSTFNSVVAIDVQTRKVVATIPVGQVPKRMNTLVMR